jgi:hypothetical protein
MSKNVSRKPTSRKIKTKSGGTRVVNVKGSSYTRKPNNKKKF